jgi:hypothetical protein
MNFVLDKPSKLPTKMNLKINIDQNNGNKPESAAMAFSISGLGNPSLLSPQITLGIDFTFNTIKNVHKVTWKNECPWYREIKEGFSWFCYCLNTKCEAYK